MTVCDNVYIYVSCHPVNMCDCIYLPMSARIKECKGNVCMTSGSLVGCPQSQDTGKKKKKKKQTPAQKELDELQKCEQRGGKMQG